MQAITRQARRLVCSAGRLLLAATFVAFAAERSSAQAPTICDQPFDSDLATFAERIRQLPHATASSKKNLLGLEGILVRPPRALRDDGPGGTYWHFTPPDHPAHPSVSCLRIFNTGGRRFSLDTQFHCQAAKERCDQLAAELSRMEQWFRPYFEAMQELRDKRVP